MSTRFFKAKFQARVVLNPLRADGTTSVPTTFIPTSEIEAASVVVAYGRNTIPTAAITVAPGRKDADPLQAGLAHPLAKRIVRRVDVLIEVKITGDRDETRQWPSNFFTLFDGFTTSVNILRSAEAVSYRINCVGWMAALLDSSVLSGKLHTTAPGPLFMGLDPLLGKVADAGTLLKVPGLNDDDIIEDLWGKALLPAFREIASSDNARVQRLDELEGISKEERTALGPTRPGNQAALAVLNRFESFDFTLGVSEEEEQEIDETFNNLRNRAFEDNKPFTATRDSLRYDQFGDQIRVANIEANELPVFPLPLPRESVLGTVSGLVQTTLFHIVVREGRFNETFWDRLLRAASNFQFSIVPAVNRATVVPITPSGNGEPHRVIKASEIFSIESSGITDRIPRGMALWTPESQSFSGILSGFSLKAPSQADFIGRFDLKKALDDEVEKARNNTKLTDVQKLALETNAEVAGLGLWIFRTIPMWLADYNAFDSALADSVRKPDSKTVSIPTAYSLGKKPDPPPDTDAEEDQEILKRVSLGDRWAHTSFLDEAFRSRVAVMSGKFRVDIAPGSTVRMETIGGNIKNIPGTNAYTGSLQGLVNQVTLQLDAETATAATILSLSHVRNESEIVSKSFSPDKHPLYNESYAGGLLVSRDEDGNFRSLLDERKAEGLKALEDFAEVSVATTIAAATTITLISRLLFANIGAPVAPDPLIESKDVPPELIGSLEK